MRKIALAAALAVQLASPAATAGSYANNPSRNLFDKEPCTTVLKALDGKLTLAHNDPLYQIAGSTGVIGLAWGYILGFDAAKGGLWKGQTTTLERFTAACKSNPSLTGSQILNSL